MRSLTSGQYECSFRTAFEQSMIFLSPFAPPVQTVQRWSIVQHTEVTHGQASVCAERRCTADFQSLSSGPCSASTAQLTLASSSGAYFVPAGSAGVSLPQRLCTRLPSLRSAARLTPQCTSATALLDYISAGRSTHCACHHWRPNLPGGCCNLFGTVCRSQYGHRRHCKFFAADRRPSFLPGHTAVLTKSVSLHWLPRDFTVILTCYVSLQS